MKKHIQTISLIALSITFAPGLFLGRSACAQTANDTIIAVVNNDAITLKDLREYLSAIYVQLSSEGANENQVKEAMSEFQKEGLDRLIDDKLLVDEAEKKELKIRDKAVDEKLDQIRKNYPSDNEFLKALVKEGLTVTELQKKITDQFKAKYIIEMEVKSKIFVNPNEVTQYYQDNINNFVKPERVELDSIFIPYSQNPGATPLGVGKAKDESGEKRIASQKAMEAINLLKREALFLEVAQRYSQSPSIGIIQKGQMLPAIENVVFGLKEGEVSGPVKTDTGIFIFKLKKRLPPETATLDEVKDNIYNMLFNQKFKKRLNLWLMDLRKKAYVEIKK